MSLHTKYFAIYTPDSIWDEKCYQQRVIKTRCDNTNVLSQQISCLGPKIHNELSLEIKEKMCKGLIKA